MEIFLKSKKGDNVFSGLTVLNDASLNAIRAAHKNVPDDYLEFLQTFGSGEIESVGFMLYNGLLDVNEIFDEEAAVLFEGVTILGGDMQGRCIGFDKNNEWAVVEIDSKDMSVKRLCDNFSLFIYNLLS